MNKLSLPIYALVLFGFVLFSAMLLSEIRYAHADATNIIPATVATTSLNAVTSTASVVFATSSCVSRIISTQASGIMIGFTDKQGFVPSGTQGFWQPASTTVSYDASQFGCGAVRIYSGTTQNITVSEAR